MVIQPKCLDHNIFFYFERPEEIFLQKVVVSLAFIDEHNSLYGCVPVAWTVCVCNLGELQKVHGIDFFSDFVTPGIR